MQKKRNKYGRLGVDTLDLFSARARLRPYTPVKTARNVNYFRTILKGREDIWRERIADPRTCPRTYSKRLSTLGIAFDAGARPQRQNGKITPSYPFYRSSGRVALLSRCYCSTGRYGADDFFLLDNIIGRILRVFGRSDEGRAKGSRTSQCHRTCVYRVDRCPSKKPAGNRTVRLASVLTSEGTRSAGVCRSTRSRRAERKKIARHTDRRRRHRRRRALRIRFGEIVRVERRRVGTDGFFFFWFENRKGRTHSYTSYTLTCVYTYYIYIHI